MVAYVHAQLSHLARFAGSTTKRLFPSAATHLRAIRLLLQPESYLTTSGWTTSLKLGRPSGPGGEPMPWMNLPIIEFLRERLSKEQRVFEYGSGYSTLFFAERVDSVISIEHDQAWLQRVREMAPSNVQVFHFELRADGLYRQSVQLHGSAADVIVIDGRDRVNCIRESIRDASERRVLILDDSERERYDSGLRFAQGAGYRLLHFVGLRPGTHLAGRSTVMYRDGNCLGL
jgi:hypothetical protein